MGLGLMNVDVGGIFNGLTGLASEFIEDKDKRNEFVMRVKEREFEFNMALVQMKTHPWVDAIVKLLYAFIPFFRPVVSACMTAAGAYINVKGIELDPAINAMLVGAFPLWMGSRHVEKGRDKK